MKGKSAKSNFLDYRVKVRIVGLSPHLLINRLLVHNITIRDINYIDASEVTFTIQGDRLSTLKKEAGYKFKVDVISEKGIRPLARNLKSRKLMLAGAVIFVLFFFAQSVFIKEIEVSGYKSLTESQIRSALAKHGLYEGATKFIDLHQVEQSLYSDFDEIVYARVRIEGKYVLVQVSEGDETNLDDAVKGRLDISVPCDIVAPRDCYIEEIRTFAGRAVCRPGDYVEKGDILITGIVPVENPTYTPKEGDPLCQYMHSEGEITARIPYFYSFEIKEKDKGTAKNLLMQWIKKNIPENAQILNKSLNFSSLGNIIRVYGKIETRQKVGIEKEISVAEPGTSKNAD